MKKPWSKWKDEDLAEEAQTGLRGQGAVVEMMRRLKDSTRYLSRATLGLTIVGAILALLQVILAFFDIPKVPLPSWLQY